MSNAEIYAPPTLIVLLLVGAGCVGASDDPTGSVSPDLGQVESMPFGSSEVRAQYLDEAGVPESVGRSSFRYPDDWTASRLAICRSGNAICPAGDPCFGWAEFSFSVDESGRAVAPIMTEACPYPVLAEPFLRAIDEWKFRPWRSGSHVNGDWTSTTMVYRIPAGV